jgi:hypothetical protein
MSASCLVNLDEAIARTGSQKAVGVYHKGCIGQGHQERLEQEAGYLCRRATIGGDIVG